MLCRIDVIKQCWKVYITTTLLTPSVEYMLTHRKRVLSTLLHSIANVGFG